MLKQRIFYNINQKKLEKFNPQDKDTGIFFDKRKDFTGRQFVMKVVKPVNCYNYEKIIQEFYKKNKEAFTVKDKDISFMCNEFLLRTYDFFGRNSVGNYMTLIDILDMIFEDDSRDKFVEFYIPSGEKDIEYVIKEFLKENKIEHFKIIKIRQLTFCINIPDAIISKACLARIFLRYLVKKRFKKLSSVVTNLFISFGIAEIGKRVKDYEVLEFERKNGIKTLKSIRKLTEHRERPFISEFYSLKYFVELWKTHREIVKKARNLNLNNLLYKNIELISPSKAILNSLFFDYSWLIIDSLMLSERICLKCKNIFFCHDIEPFMEALSSDDNNRCKKYVIQYQIIYPNCAYNILKKPEELKIEYELVWNEYSKKILVNYYGYPEEKVIIIGNVRFNKIPKKEIQEKINIVLATPGDVYPEILDFFLDSVKNVENNNLQFYIKPHPGDNLKRIRAKIKNSSVRLITDLDNALRTADVIASYSSTVVYEALYNNIPVIIINPYDFHPSGVPFYKYYPYFNDKQKFKIFLEDLNKDTVKKIKVPRELKINDFDGKLFEKLIAVNLTK